MKKSLKFNMLLNILRSLMSLLFPLITFPYISRVLGTVSLGKINFSSSIANYFILFAGLGISTYAVREGAKLRNDKTKFDLFVSQMFSINLGSTIISFICLIISIFMVNKLQNYIVLIAIYSAQMIFKLIGVEYIYNIYEEYVYITIRGLLVQVVSVILMFIFVKTEDDAWIYACISVFSAGGAYLFNYYHSRKYCRPHLTLNIDFRKHIKSILIFFATNLMATIYVSADVTILGFISDDYEVGIYSAAVKVYTIIKGILASSVVVSIPQLSEFIAQNKIGKFRTLAEEIHGTLLSLLLPACVGLIFLRKEVILIISGTEYIEATACLFWLSIAMIFSLGSYFWGQCILFPNGKEAYALKITIITAVINVILNFIMIPIWGATGAAISTTISEFLVLILDWIGCSTILKAKEINTETLKIVMGCGCIAFVCKGCDIFIENMILKTVLSGVISIVIYGFVEVVLKNNAVTSIMHGLLYYMRRLYKNKGKDYSM